MLDEDDGGAELVVGVEDEPAHVLLLFGVHPRHRLVEEEQIGLRGEGPPELHPLLEPVGQAVDGGLPDRLDLEEVDDPLHRVAVLHLLAPRRPEVERLPQEVAAHLEVAPGHEVVEHRHALEQGDVLERAGDPGGGRLVGPHPRARHPPEGDRPFLRVVEAVDDVEHGALAGAVGADDGADLALADVEAHPVDRAHPAEREADVMDVEDHLSGRRRHPGSVPRVRLRRLSHRLRSEFLVPGGLTGDRVRERTVCARPSRPPRASPPPRRRSRRG